MRRRTGFVIFVGAAIFSFILWSSLTPEPIPLVVQPLPSYDAARIAEPGLLPENLRVPEPFKIRRGQTLSGLLAELGVPSSEIYSAIQATAEYVDVRRIRAGEEGLVYYGETYEPTAVELHVAGKGRLELECSGDGWESRWRASVRVVEKRRVEGELTDFLEASVRRAGADPRLAYRMSDVLQWDLDFNRDLRLGDRFEAIYEEIYLDGELAGLGDVQALIYENRGLRHEAYRHGDGYYDAEGRPLQKMFLRSPLPFSRVTSRFSHRRFHPVLKVHRPHYGVDYGAPAGTPVRVTAHGVVIFAGRNGGAGKMVKVRHPNGYVTAYLHLSRYASGIRSGKRVRQGDVVGYVGSTGLATASHLDYRVQRNGKWIDPLSIKSVPAEPLSASELPSFRARRDALRRALAGGELDLPDLAPPEPPRRVARLAVRDLDEPAAAR